MSLKSFDNCFLSKKIKLIAGIDEAGRGPLAGPVVAAAVIFNTKVFIDDVKDSKKLTERKREELFDLIRNQALSVGIGIVEHFQIDQINILQATLRAMKIAASKLIIKPDLILIDGNKSFNTKTPTKTIVRGDGKSFAIAAASIIAKVTRDRIMKEASDKYPQFLWHKNKGYATRHHINALKKFGVTPLHRKTFLSKILNKTKEELLFET